MRAGGGGARAGICHGSLSHPCHGFGSRSVVGEPHACRSRTKQRRPPEKNIPGVAFFVFR